MQRFSDWVRARLADQGKKQKWLAKQLAISDSALSSDLASNKFSEDKIAAIAVTLDHQEASVDVKSWLLRFDISCTHKKARLRTKSPANRYGSELDAMQVYRNMSDSDVLICNTCSVLPLEMDDNGDKLLMKCLASAIAKGASFLYLTPDEEIAAFHSSHTHANELAEKVIAKFERYKLEIGQDLRASLGIQKEVAEQMVNSRLHLVPCGPAFGNRVASGMFWVPHITFGVNLAMRRNKSVSATMSIRLPCDQPDESPILWLQDCSAFALDYSNFLRASIKNRLASPSVESNDTRTFLENLLHNYFSKPWKVEDVRR